MPRQVSADGGFASKDNLADAKELKVKDVVFAKKRGLSVIDMAKSAGCTKSYATSGQELRPTYQL